MYMYGKNRLNNQDTSLWYINIHLWHTFGKNSTPLAHFWQEFDQ